MTSSPRDKALWPTRRQVFVFLALFATVAFVAIAAPRPPAPEPPASLLLLPWVVFLGVALGATRRARSRGASRATQVLYAGSIYLGSVFLSLAVVAIAWTFGAEPGQSIVDEIGRFLFPASPYPADEVLKLVGITIVVAMFAGGGFVLLRHLMRHLMYPDD